MGQSFGFSSGFRLDWDTRLASRTSVFFCPLLDESGTSDDATLAALCESSSLGSLLFGVDTSIFRSPNTQRLLSGASLSMLLSENVSQQQWSSGSFRNRSILK